MLLVMKWYSPPFHSAIPRLTTSELLEMVRNREHIHLRYKVVLVPLLHLETQCLFYIEISKINSKNAFSPETMQ